MANLCFLFCFLIIVFFYFLQFSFHCCFSPSCQVFVDQLTGTDIEFIGDSMFPGIDKEIISKMVAFNNTVGFSLSIVKKQNTKISVLYFSQ